MTLHDLYDISDVRTERKKEEVPVITLLAVQSMSSVVG